MASRRADWCSYHLRLAPQTFFGDYHAEYCSTFGTKNATLYRYSNITLKKGDECAQILSLLHRGSNDVSTRQHRAEIGRLVNHFALDPGTNPFRIGTPTGTGTSRFANV